MCINDNVQNDRDVFFNGVKNHVSHDVAQSVDANISEDEVEHVMSHLANDKRLGWDGLTHELFMKYVIKQLYFRRCGHRGKCLILGRLV